MGCKTRRRLIVRRHDMAPRKSILLIVVSVVQTIFWLPFLFMQPWTLPTPVVFSHRWVVWFPGAFDLGTATDFFPAVVMIAGGLLAIVIGFRRRLTHRFIDVAVWCEILAAVVFVLMYVIGTVAGVRFWPIQCFVILPFQVVPPLASVFFLRRRRRTIQPVTP
jgi:hypothetical protein